MLNYLFDKDTYNLNTFNKFNSKLNDKSFFFEPTSLTKNNKIYLFDYAKCRFISKTDTKIPSVEEIETVLKDLEKKLRINRKHIYTLEKTIKFHEQRLIKINQIAESFFKQS